MSVTYGFYNSKNKDRRYDAIQMSSIFDGIIRDGILQHVGTAMMVKESTGMMVNVGIGRAWFNHTWTLNDALLPLTVPQSEVILNRIDAVILEVDSRESVRANTIKIVKGTPATNPVKPSMIKTNDRWQYPLAYIRVNSGVTSIRQENITNAVGTSECPFVTLRWRRCLLMRWLLSGKTNGMPFMKKKPRTWRQQILSGKTNGQNGLMHRQKKFNNPIWTGKNSGMIGMRRKRRICRKQIPIGNSYGRPGSTSTRTIIHPKWLHGERTPKLYLMSGSNS